MSTTRQRILDFIHRPATERAWNLKHDRAMRLALGALAILFVLQGAFWVHTRTIMPEMGIVPDVPGEQTVRALSFGDEEAFFRLLALNIQTSGDTFGRFTALYKYDFNKLYHWFRLLDGLNNQSNYMPSLASYYFSQTQNPRDVRYIVDYLDEHTEGRVKEKWWWIVQAAYLASNKLGDTGRALQLAERLRGEKTIPIWAQQMPAFIHEKRGEFGDALAIMKEIVENPQQLSKGELNFMEYFVRERLGKMNALEKEIAAARTKLEKTNAPMIITQPPPPDVGAAQVPGAH